MTPEELQKRIQALEEIVYNHTHRGYDRTPTLPATSLTAASAVPGGSDTQIQFNDGDSFAGSSLMTFDKNAGGTLSLNSPSGSGSQNGGEIDIFGGDGGGTSGDGASIFIVGGSAHGNNDDGGIINLAGGLPNGTGKKGDILLNYGDKATTVSGGFICIPTMQGAPSGTPSQNGSVVYDRTNLKLYIWAGSWKSVTLT